MPHTRTTPNRLALLEQLVGDGELGPRDAALVLARAEQTLHMLEDSTSSAEYAAATAAARPRASATHARARPAPRPLAPPNIHG